MWYPQSNWKLRKDAKEELRVRCLCLRIALHLHLSAAFYFDLLWHVLILGRESALSMLPEAVYVIEASHAVTSLEKKHCALIQIKQEHFHRKVQHGLFFCIPVVTWLLRVTFSGCPDAYDTQRC